MKRKTTPLYAIGLLTLLLSVAGCSLTREDVGPYQGDTQLYSLTNFDRLDMGSAFTITVQQGPAFTIMAEGDRRNLDDLDVYMRNGTLYARYRNARRRAYETAFTITMPTLRGVAFSGASKSIVTGFSNLSNLDIELSGASTGKFTMQATQTNLTLSGASDLQLSGNGRVLSASLSGASILHAFTYPVSEADLDASGASKVNVNVVAKLTAKASGASSVRYRGKPIVRQQVSGASTIDEE